MEGGWLNQLGHRAISPYYGRGAYSMQTRGAFVVMVVSVFWVARRHFKDVAMKALGRALDAATRPDGRIVDQVPSTKGTLTA